MGPIREGYFQRLQRGRRMPAPLFAGLGALLLIYLGTLIVRGPDTSWPLVDDWGVAAFELVLGVLCIARGWVHPAGRRIPFVLGAALVSWAIGDAVLAAESSGGASPDTPSLADLFYLGFYPIAYVAILMLIRTEVRKFLTLSWLDGAVAGLGAAALCAAFAFNTIMQTTGDSPLAVATNLAYPAGDLLLFALVVAGTTVLPGRLRAPWLLLASGCAINGIGDTFNLFHLTGTASKFGAVFDGVAWPTAVLLISASVWLPRGYRRRSTEESTAGFALPGLAAFSALAVLCAGTVHRIDSVALGLAAATLITVGVRLTLSVTRLKAITEERHHQAITDDLTGMANRRRLFHLLDGFFTHHDDDVQPPDAGLAFLYIDLDRFK